MIILNNMNIIVRNIAVAALCAVPVSGLAMEVNLTPGKFVEEVLRVNGATDSNVTLTGQADARDLMAMASLRRTVTSLDMSQLSILAYDSDGSDGLTARKYAAGEIPPYMLFDSAVEEIVLPASLSAIGDHAFSASNLKSIRIPAFTRAIGDDAFSDCHNLTSVDVCGDVDWGAGVFRNCTALRKVDCEIKHVPKAFFEGCVSLEYTPLGMAAVGDRAFKGCGLRSVDLTGVEEIGEFAFAEMPRLEMITSTGNGIRKIGKGAFFNDPRLSGSPSWSGNVPALLLAATPMVRYSSMVDSEVIGTAAFAGTKVNDSIALGPKVRKIEGHAFRAAHSLNILNVAALGGNVPEVTDEAFSGLENDEGRYSINLQVDRGNSAVWRAHPVWSKFNISDVTSSAPVMTAENVEVAVRRVNDGIEVISTLPIDAVEIYAASGTLVAGNTPRAERTFLSGIPQGEVMLVKVVAGDTMKIVKVL